MDTLYSRKNVKVARKNAKKETLLRNGFITERDAEMDERAKEAVKAAINKLKVKGKPIAEYNPETNEAYLVYPNGEKEIVRK